MEGEPSDEITWSASGGLTLHAMLWSSMPPGSFEIPPDVQPLQLDTVLRPALEKLGLADRADEIWQAVHETAEPFFRKGVEEIEAARRDALKGFDEQ